MFNFNSKKAVYDEQYMKEREELYAIIKAQQEAVNDLTKSIALLATLCNKKEES